MPSVAQSRTDWVAGTALLAGVACAGWLGGLLPPALRLAAWGALVLAAAVLFRRGWVTLFGPLLFYDLVRTARRRQTTVVRALYAGLLLGLLACVGATWCYEHRVGF